MWSVPIEDSSQQLKIRRRLSKRLELRCPHCGRQLDSRSAGHGVPEQNAEGAAGSGDGPAPAVDAGDEASLGGSHGDMVLAAVQEQRAGDPHGELHVPDGHLAALPQDGLVVHPIEGEALHSPPRHPPQRLPPQPRRAAAVPEPRLQAVRRQRAGRHRGDDLLVVGLHHPATMPMHWRGLRGGGARAAGAPLAVVVVAGGGGGGVRVGEEADEVDDGGELPAAEGPLPVAAEAEQVAGGEHEGDHGQAVGDPHREGQRPPGERPPRRPDDAPSAPAPAHVHPPPWPRITGDRERDTTQPKAIANDADLASPLPAVRVRVCSVRDRRGGSDGREGVMVVYTEGAARERGGDRGIVSLARLGRSDVRRDRTGQGDLSGKPQAEAWAGEGERHGARARMGGGFFLFFQAEDREETGEARAFSTSDAVCKLQICSFVSSVSHPSSMELSEKCVFFSSSLFYAVDRLEKCEREALSTR